MFEQDVAGRTRRFGLTPSARGSGAWLTPTRTGRAGLIKALRANKNDEQGVIEQALEECRKEIKQSDIDLKAAAVLKLVYVSDPGLVSWPAGPPATAPSTELLG